MSAPAADEEIRVLMLEDDPLDAALVKRWLAKIGMKHSVRWVQTRENFLRELETFAPQLILSDYKMPSFDGLAALALLRAKNPDIPFILVSGTIGEDMAAEALKRGATDYVLKDRLERLEIAVNRALRERQERRERLKAEAALRESQARLQQAQKMEALGRLSGGVAHDFNNILSAITGYCELTLTSSKLDDSLRPDLKEVVAAAFRAAALTRQLLAFSRRQVFAPKILDLNRTLKELDRMLQRIIGEDIRLSVSLDPALGRIRVDADQVGQVILNLVVNARDAMPQGGTLVLKTANVELGEASKRAHPDALPGRHVLLTVEDSGVGMDAETLSRIFEPFFTTKGKDKGTGLGLATVYGIVKQSHGHLEVESRPGRGSAFRVYLPSVEGEVDVAVEAPAPGSLQGTETVLVVDDDAAIGLIARRILESYGYAVLQACGGEDALRQCAASSQPLHLILTDVVMSQMSGPELVSRLKAARPRCKVLYFSGYAESVGQASSLSSDKEHFLAKPFTTENLIKTVRRLLDAP